MEKQEVITEGAAFAEGVIQALCTVGVPDEALLFYGGMIGTLMGNIVAHVGKDAALTLLDNIRDMIADCPLDKKVDFHA